MDRRDAAGADAVGEGVAHGRVALRRRTPPTPRSTRLRLDDLRPHIYRTRDGGKTWQHIANGIPDGGIINVVREDPQRRGLLFAGTEQAVYVSFDDGDHWQSLRLNMPATSIRDLVIKDDDLVVGTHGRSFWILDDITPLRQMPADAVRGRCPSVHAAARRGASGGTRTPTRRCRPTSRPARIRPTAPSSTTG